MGKYDSSIGLAEKLLEEDNVYKKVEEFLSLPAAYGHDIADGFPLTKIKLALAHYYQTVENTESIRDNQKLLLDLLNEIKNMNAINLKNQQILQDIKEELKLNKTK